MSEATHETGGTGPSHRGLEVGVALAFAVMGIIAVVGSLRIGAGWGSDGPQAGFFPFYTGLLIIVASAVNLAKVFLTPEEDQPFATWGQLRQVGSVVLPTAVYVFIIPYIGIYVASALLIAVFMRWIGRYGWATIAAVAITVPIVNLIVFEMWFLVSLPKGPIEKIFGF